MKHRHLNANVGWSLAAIDSVLERGTLADWRELFDQARHDRELAIRVLEVAKRHEMPGVLPIAIHIIQKDWPDLVSA